MNICWKISVVGLRIFRALCLIILVTGAALQFASIQTFVLNSLLSNKKQSVKISGFSGLFPFYFSLKNFDFYENNHPKLTIRNLEVEWSVLNSLHYKLIAIPKLMIEQIMYHESHSNQPANSNIIFPTIPLGYIANIKINEAIYKTPQQEFKYSINGHTRNKTDGLDFNLELKNLHISSDLLTASINYTYSSAGKDAALKVNVTGKEKRGLLHHLVPSLNGAVDLTLRGEGPLSKFKGEMKAKIGNTSISSSLNTTHNTGGMPINIYLVYQHTHKENNYTFSGSAQTNAEITHLQLHNCVLRTNKEITLTMAGDIRRKNMSISTHNLSIVAPLSSQYILKVIPQVVFNPYNLSFKGVIKNHLLLLEEKIATIDTFISFNKTIENLSFSLKGNVDIPTSSPNYKKYSNFVLEGKLAPLSMLTPPTFNLHLSGGLGNLSCAVLISDHPHIKINGNILSNAVRIESFFKNGSWHITGKSPSSANHALSVEEFAAKIEQKNNSDFDLDGTMSLNIQSKAIDLKLKGSLDFLRKYLTITSLQATHKESFIESKGNVDFLNWEGGFDWHFYTFNLGDLLTSSASGTASILGQLSIDPREHRLTFSGDFHKIFLGDISAHSGNIDGSLQLNNQKNIQLSLSAQKAVAYNTVVEDFSTSTNGTLDHFSTTISMTGFAEQALKGNLAFSVLDLSTLELEALSVQIGPNKILLGQPTQMQWIMDKLVINTTTLNTSTGSIKFKGELSPLTYDMSISLQNISSDLLHTLSSGAYFLKGDVNGYAWIKGAKSDPIVKFDFQTSAPLYSTDVSGSLQSGDLKTTINVKSDNLNLNLKGAYPLKLPISLSQYELNPLKPLKTDILASGNLDDLQKVFDFNYDKVSGDIDADISISGTTSNPISRGHIKITNGKYERQNIGLKLTDINLGLSAKSGHFILDTPSVFKNHEYGLGTISFAKLGIHKNLIPYLSTEINFNKIQVINLPQTRRGGMSAVGSGSLKAKGPVNALDIYLRGEISTLEKYIGETDDVPIFHVNVQHQNLPTTLPSSKENQQGHALTTYDIDLLLDRKFHIFGQGLDSNWKGRLIVQGTSNDPVYKGQFVLQDGQLRILDRFFDVQKGEIVFDGDLSPTLYIESNLNLQDMRVKIILEGSTDNLQTKITSDKALSEQEILQKLFFNRASAVSQSFQALNYFVASSFISSFMNIGFYQQDDPITHSQREFISLKQKFSKMTYGKVDVAIDNNDLDSDKVSIALGIQPTPQTKTELTFSPDNNRIGTGIEWEIDF